MLSIPPNGLYSGESSSSDNIAQTAFQTQPDNNNNNNNNNYYTNNDYYNYYDCVNGDNNTFTLWQNRRNNNSHSDSTISSSSDSDSESEYTSTSTSSNTTKHTTHTIDDPNTNIVTKDVNHIERNTAKGTKHGQLYNKKHHKTKGYWRMEDKVEDMPWGMNQYRPVVPTNMMAP